MQNASFAIGSGECSPREDEYMFDWIMLTLGAVYLTLVSVEVCVQRVCSKKKDLRVYEEVAKALSSAANDTNEDEDLTPLPIAIQEASQARGEEFMRSDDL